MIKSISKIITMIFFFQLFSQSARSLPNQPISQVVKWSKNNSFISELKFQKPYESGVPEFTAVGKSNNATFTLNIWTNKKNIVTAENIDYRPLQNKSSTLLFERNNQDGLLLIKQIYGNEIVKDFIKSIYVRKEKDNLGWENRFYSGSKYAYQCSNTTESNIYHFTILNKRDLQNHIKKMIEIRNDPNFCC